MPIEGVGKNEVPVDKPKNKEERQRERLQKKIDNLQKKEAKFNEKLNKINTIASEKEAEIVKDTRKNMNYVTGLTFNSYPTNTNQNTGGVLLGINKDIPGKNDKKTNISFSVEGGSTLQKFKTNPKAKAVEWGNTIGEDTPMESSSGTSMESGPSPIQENTASGELDGGAGSSDAGMVVDNGPGTANNILGKNGTRNTPNQYYIKPELGIKTIYPSGFNAGGKLGFVYNTETGGKGYGAGTIGYTNKKGWGVEGTVGLGVTRERVPIPVSTEGEQNSSPSAAPGESEDGFNFDKNMQAPVNTSSRAGDQNSSPSAAPGESDDGPVIIEYTTSGGNVSQTSETNTSFDQRMVFSPYGGVKVYKDRGNFSANINVNISKQGPSVGAGITYKF